MSNTKYFGYSAIKTIILNCKDPTKQALLAIDYGFACRIGELAKEYKHWYSGKPYISKGSVIADFTMKKESKELNFRKPNFKQVKLKNVKGEIDGVQSFESFINYNFEPWLFEIILNYVKGKDPNEPLFVWKVSRLRDFVRVELKKYNSNASSHWLRHSRAYHIGEITGDPYAVQAVLGHADPRTSMQYVSQMRRSIYKAMDGGKTFEDYLGVKVV